MVDPNEARFVADPMRSRVKTLWMEQCQVAYLRAVAAQACCSMAKPEPDIHGVDWHLQHERAQIPIGIQLRSAHEEELSGEHVTFAIDKKLHDILRAKDSYYRYLFVLILPNDGNWVVPNCDALRVRWCMYWLSVRGEGSLRTKSHAYQIDRSHQVTPQWLCSVFEEFAKEFEGE